MRMKKQYGVWDIGFGDKITANQLRKPKNVWVIGEYGLCEVWVIGELTVVMDKSEWLYTSLDTAQP